MFAIFNRVTEEGMRGHNDWRQVVSKMRVRKDSIVTYSDNHIALIGGQNYIVKETFKEIECSLGGML